MAYQDPYAGQYGRYQHQPQQYAQPQQHYGNYGDAAPEFNPYTTAEQPHQTYEQGAYDNYGGGYRDDPTPDHRGYAPPERRGTQHSYADAAPPPLAAKSLDETSRFDPGEFTPSPRGPKTASNLRRYRQEFQGPLWTKGGRGRCFGRFFCCTFMIIIFLFVTIVLSLVLWLRPPSISFGDVAPMTSGSAVQLTGNGINLNMGVNISVDNPNFFAVTFKKITAEIYYPINNTAIGNGTANNLVFESNAQTNFTFPFTIDYSTSLDPQNLILLDLAKKCGILGNKSNLSVDYKITLGLQILFVTISPSISNSFSFACPLDADDLSSLLGGAGIGNIGGREEDAPSLPQRQSYAL
ncbi:hypothetical protein C8R43DRAFT_29726 [Mycena crocata]|nr:hypothetical protein C8R43DRAFT_29726 [Mycena crocata]